MGVGERKSEETAASGREGRCTHLSDKRVKGRALM